MSQYPGQYPNQDSNQAPDAPSTRPYAVTNYYAATPMPNPRPAIVTGTAVTGMVLAILALLGSGFGAVINAIMISNGGRNPLAPQLPPMEPSRLLIGLVQTLVRFFLAFVMLVGCIGAISLKQWALRLLRRWAVVTLGWAAIVVVLAITVHSPGSRNVGTRQVLNPAALRLIRYVSLATSTAITALVPLLVLCTWKRPEVSAAFGEVPIPPTAGYASTPPAR